MGSALAWLTAQIGWAAQHSEWLIVFCFGVIVGAGELVSRHRDAPFASLFLRPALLYLLINGLASIAALALIYGSGLAQDQAPWMPVVIAGFGAMLLLRTSIAIGTGPDKVNISLSTYFEQFRRAADEEVSRARGEDRGRLIQGVLLNSGATFARSKEALPTVCMALHRFVSDQDRASLSTTIKGLSRKTSGLSDRQKLRLLGYSLLDVVGPGVLRAAVRDLGKEIAGDPEPEVGNRSTIIRELLIERGVSYAKAKTILFEVCLTMVPSTDRETAAALGTTLGKIEQNGVTDRQRLILLAYALLDVFEISVLRAAVEDLGAEILGNDPPAPSTTLPAPPPPPAVTTTLAPAPGAPTTAATALPPATTPPRLPTTTATTDSQPPTEP